MSIQIRRFEMIKQEYEEQGELSDKDDHRWLIEKLGVAWAEIEQLWEKEHPVIHTPYWGGPPRNSTKKKRGADEDH